MRTDNLSKTAREQGGILSEEKIDDDMDISISLKIHGLPNKPSEVYRQEKKCMFVNNVK